jgi:hypothetical protein
MSSLYTVLEKIDIKKIRCSILECDGSRLLHVCRSSAFKVCSDMQIELRLGKVRIEQQSTIEVRVRMPVHVPIILVCVWRTA